MDQLVHNATGALIPKGKAVYCTGLSLQLLDVALAMANSMNTMPAMGITLEAIGNGADGRVGLEELLPGVDTSAYTLGDKLYVSATQAGELTNVMPSLPNFQQHVGHVALVAVNGIIALRSHGLETILVNQAAGGELEGNYPNPTVGSVHAGSAHTGYQLKTEKGTANGYAGLDTSGFVPDAQLPPGLTRDLEHPGLPGHHAEVHNLDSHATRAHSELTGIGATDHHSNVNDHANVILTHGDAAHNALTYEASGAVTTHAGAADPHTGYRLESADHTHQTTGAQAGQLDHGLAITGLLDDDHTQYQLESEKGAVSGYASLDAGTKVPTAQLGSGIADATTFLRGDQSYAAPTASVADPNPQSYTPGTFTLATGKYIITSKRIQVTGVQRITLQGTARWRHT